MRCLKPLLVQTVGTVSQLLSHLDGDALNVALLVPESRSVVPGFLIKSLSDHYNAPGRLAGYKRQFQRVFRRLGDDPSIFAIELETLARRAFIDIDTSIQLQMVRDRFIDGQAECALRRHLNSLGPPTPMADIVDCCRVWERHREVESMPRMSVDRCPARAICQITEDEPAPAASPETENWENIIRKLLPTPALPPQPAVPIPSDLTDGSVMSTNAGGTGMIASDGLGNYVTELASSQSGHGGGCCFAGPTSRFRRGVFFVRGVDPYDGPMQDS